MLDYGFNGFLSITNLCFDTKFVILRSLDQKIEALGIKILSDLGSHLEFDVLPVDWHTL